MLDKLKIIYQIPDKYIANLIKAKEMINEFNDIKNISELSLLLNGSDEVETYESGGLYFHFIFQLSDPKYFWEKRYENEIWANESDFDKSKVCLIYESEKNEFFISTYSKVISQFPILTKKDFINHLTEIYGNSYAFNLQKKSY